MVCFVDGGKGDVGNVANLDNSFNGNGGDGGTAMCAKSACFDPGTRQPDQFSCEMFYFFSGEAILCVANGENGGNGSPSNGFCGTNGGIGGLAIGLGSQTNGENGQSLQPQQPP